MSGKGLLAIGSGIGGIGGGFNINGIATSLGSTLTMQESKLTSLIASSGDDASTADLLNIQAALQKWTQTVNLETNMIKAFGDAITNVIRNTT